MVQSFSSDGPGPVAYLRTMLMVRDLEQTIAQVIETAAECTALGGLAFHANQTCAQANCSILCNVCGRKFSDTNRNGVQDGGELGLAGWTVELRDLANNLVGSAVTNANGDYCFNNIQCANYLVTEAAQPGWVKVAPAGPGHFLSLPLATTVNNADFANYSCPTPPPCVPMPQGLAAWWPFDDGPGTTQAADVTHTKIGRNRLVLVGGSSGQPDLASRRRRHLRAESRSRWWTVRHRP